MPKHGKGKKKAAVKPLAAPSLDNRPRYCTPEVQVFTPQLPTPEPTPPARTGNWQVSVERAEMFSEANVVFVSSPLKMAPLLDLSRRQ